MGNLDRDKTAAQALSYFISGFNCAESVLLICSEVFNIQALFIPRIATGFGGGIGKQGEACGAVTGGVMALNLLYGRDDAERREDKETAYAKAAEFMKRFEEQNGNLRCGELLQVDIGTDAGLDLYRKRGLKEDVCIGAVNSAVRLVLEISEE